MIEIINGTSTCEEVGSSTECFYEFVPTYEVSTTTATTATTTFSEYQEADLYLSMLLVVTVCTFGIGLGVASLYKKRTYLQYGGGDVEIRGDL